MSHKVLSLDEISNKTGLLLMCSLCMIVGEVSLLSGSKRSACKVKKCF